MLKAKLAVIRDQFFLLAVAWYMPSAVSVRPEPRFARIERSLKREKEQKNPCVSEVCRRFLADEKDFSKENLKRLHITDKIVNDSVENALREIVLRIKSGR